MQRLPLMMIKYIVNVKREKKRIQIDRGKFVQIQTFFFILRLGARVEGGWCGSENVSTDRDRRKTMMGPCTQKASEIVLWYILQPRAQLYRANTHILSIEMFQNFSNLIIYLYSFFPFPLSRSDSSDVCEPFFVHQSAHGNQKETLKICNSF